MSKKVYAYIRGENEKTIEAQVSELKGFASKMGYTITEIFVEKDRKKRPVLADMLALLEKTSQHSILTTSYDRISRDIMKIAEIRKYAEIITPQGVPEEKVFEHWKAIVQANRALTHKRKK